MDVKRWKTEEADKRGAFFVSAYILSKEDGQRHPCVLRWQEDVPSLDTVTVVVESSVCTTASDTRENFFEALVEIRQSLEKRGLLVACFGACRNVYPSPMILSMGTAELAYRLSPGRQARTEDLVSIFDYDDLEELATVDQQAAFYEDWCSSL